MTDADTQKLPYLPEDVLLIILELVESTASPSTLAPLARVSRSLHRRFFPLLYNSPILTQHKCSGFFSGLLDGSIDEEEKKHWQEGELEDKRSPAARRLIMLRYVWKLHLDDLEAVEVCHAAIGAFLELRLGTPPRKLYKPRILDPPPSGFLFYAPIAPTVHLSSTLLDAWRSSESPCDSMDEWFKLFKFITKPYGVLSFQMPEKRPGTEAEADGATYQSFLESLCRKMKPRLLVIDDIVPDDFGGTCLDYAVFASQRGVAFRYRDSADAEAIVHTRGKVAELLW
ncbi:hypothetical protein L198_07269 [Cryptococcus wingfieldii CBS 7118]|uniref:F-box domain-containing protein n=1 Tax=Cryptococcus wingfieldii CBS 7118 TaxID=1295528 RepID=A0A1E3IDS0_9TREE|nr:hypothetical protein L198_07269 [Cryptococcus wingfieldii CBS 7118]ODN86575.1 hypothetical protein L198_07269 [Cryptococcus wingfieldii CBS 7118]